MKLFIKLVAGLLSLLVLAVVALVIAIDPNDYKEEIQAQVKQTMNRELLINGDLSWTFYPQIGFSSGEIALHNPAGFNRKDLLKIESAAISLAVFPLLTGEIEIGELTVKGLVVNLITNKDGSSNLDNMFPEKTASTAQQSAEKHTEHQQREFSGAHKLQLAGINIENVQLEVQDLKMGSATKVDIDHIRLGTFVLGKESDLSIVTNVLVAEMAGHIDLQAKLIVVPDFTSVQLNKLNLQTEFTGSELPKGKINSLINTDLAYNIATNTAELTDFNLQLNKINLKGHLSVQAANKTKVRFALQGNEWDLNPYLAEKSEEPVKESEGTKASTDSTAEQEPDLSFLNTLDVNGTLTIAGIKAQELKIGEINSTIEVNQGKAQVKPLTVQLYQGLLTVNGWVADAQGANSYSINSQVKEVQIQPLLLDAAKVDLLSGSSAFNFSANGKGLTPSKIKSGLVGSGDFQVLDGELYGINIPQEIRALKAKLTASPAPTEENIKKTDFASLTGKFNIKKGIIDNNHLLMLSPVIRLDGAGLLDILKESLDYKLSVTPLSKSDEKTALQDLSGITIPLLIKGTFTEPKFSLDTEGALKEQLKAKTKALEDKAKAELQKQQHKLQEESQQKLKEESKKIEEKLQKGLGKLFG